MDPITILGLSYVGKEAMSVVAHFVKEVLGPSASAIGDGIAAPWQVWAQQRAERAQKVVVDAALMLEGAGIAPKPVPGRILMPLLQHASVEEDDYLQRQYAALLASAADSTSDRIILPAYTEMLHQLTPFHVRMLDLVYRQHGEGRIDVDAISFMNLLGLNQPTVLLFMADLHRLQVVERLFEVVWDTETVVDAESGVSRSFKSNAGSGRHSARLTTLGYAFVTACRYER